MDNIRFDTGGWLSGPMLDVEGPTMAERIQLRWLRQQHPDFQIGITLFANRLMFFAYGDHTTSPHTVITDDLGELVEALTPLG
jgi:hypothetical protein